MYIVDKICKMIEYLLNNILILLLIFSRYMIYYNCAKFHRFSIFSFGVSRGGGGGGGVKMTPQALTLQKAP